MGEKADDLDYPASDSMNDATFTQDSAATQDETADTQAIREDIEQTRAEMSQTIDAIQERLNPQHVVEQVKDTVREATVGKVEDMVSNVTDTARNTGSGIMDTIKSNPIPAALAGATLGWLFLKSGNAGKSNQPRYETRTYSAYGYPATGVYPEAHNYYAPQQPGLVGRFMDSVKENPIPAAIAGVSIGYMVMQGQGQKEPDYRYGYQSQSYGQPDMGQKAGDMVNRAGQKVGDLAGNVGDKVGQAASNVGDTVGNVAGNVGDTVGNVAGNVGDTMGNVASNVGDTVGNIAGNVGDTVGNVAEGVQYQTRQAKNQLQRMMEENPLMLGAVALAAGAAIGILLPSTQPEKELMGEARDNLLDKAQEVVGDTLHKVGNVAQTVTDEVQHTVKEEAQNQGLLGNDKQQNQQNQSSQQGSGQPNRQSNQPNRESSQMPRMETSMSRPAVMTNLTSTQMDQLERQARQNDHEGFMRAAESYGWDKQTCEQVWNFMTHQPSKEEVYRAFEGQGGQPGQQTSR